MIIVFGNKKGGVGKSVTAINLAGAIVNRLQGTKRKVCVVDADTNETIVNYVRRRETFNEEIKARGGKELRFIKSELRRPDDSLTRDLKELDNLYDYVIVDTGGYENRAFKSSIPVADIVYLPLMPSQVDIEQLVPTLSVIKQIEENIQDSISPEFTVDARLLLTQVESTSNDLFIEAKAACQSLLPYASISSIAIPRVKQIRKIQEVGITLADDVPEQKISKHPKRAVFEMLLDEIDGNREVQTKRSMTSDASDA